jgi:hypothetical protein
MVLAVLAVLASHLLLTGAASANGAAAADPCLQPDIGSSGFQGTKTAVDYKFTVIGLESITTGAVCHADVRITSVDGNSDVVRIPASGHASTSTAVRLVSRDVCRLSHVQAESGVGTANRGECAVEVLTIRAIDPDHTARAKSNACFVIDRLAPRSSATAHATRETVSGTLVARLSTFPPGEASVVLRIQRPHATRNVLGSPEFATTPLRISQCK